MEQALWYEGELLVEYLLKNKNKPANTQYPVRLAAASIIYGLCFGYAKDLRQDKDFLQFLASQKEFQETQKAGGNPADLIPWLSVFFQHRLKGFVELTGTFRKFLGIKLEEHQKSYSPEYQRDVTDSLIKITAEQNEEELAAINLQKEHILGTNADLIGAGFNTVVVMLNWCIHYLTVMPEIQQQVQKEIDEVLGSRLPKPGDRSKMPYVEATLLETIRHSAQIPFLLPHSTIRDTELNGYHVPKDTLVFVNMYAVGRDPSVWQDADTFDPTRFFDADGKVDKSKGEDIFAFGGGKRRCLGEFVARQEAFVFFTMMFQRLRFEKVPGVNYDLNGKFGLAIEPKEYEYIVRDRAE